MRSKILLVIILLSLANKVHGLEESCSNATDRVECCKNFEEKIWQFGISPGECCNYPKIVTPHFNPCFNQCISNSSIEMNLRCCVVACCFKKLGIITEQPEVDGIQAEGIKFSFMISVQNDTKWANVINQTVDECHANHARNITEFIMKAQAKKDYSSIDNFWDCFETVPNYMYKITDCCYARLFYRCPYFAEDTEYCPEWRLYTEQCIIAHT